MTGAIAHLPPYAFMVSGQEELYWLYIEFVNVLVYPM
jgi:hypothetical protein